MKDAVRKMILVMLAAAFVIIIVGTIFSGRFPAITPLPFAVGVLLTTALNIVKTLWLERIAEKLVLMEDQSAAGNYVRVQYMLRMVLTAAILTLAAIAPDHIISMWGAVLGIFTFHAGKYSLAFTTNNDRSD